MSSSWRTFWLSFLCSATILALLCGFALPTLAEELPPAPSSEVETLEPTVPDLVPDVSGTESQPETSTPEEPPPESIPEETVPESSSSEESSSAGGSASLPEESLPEESSSMPEELLPPEGENSGIVPGSRLDINDPNITVTEAIFQIRYVLIFFVFGVIPLLCAVVFLFFFYRWVYRLIVGFV